MLTQNGILTNEEFTQENIGCPGCEKMNSFVKAIVTLLLISS